MYVSASGSWLICSRGHSNDDGKKEMKTKIYAGLLSDFRTEISR